MTTYPIPLPHSGNTVATPLLRGCPTTEKRAINAIEELTDQILRRTVHVRNDRFPCFCRISSLDGSNDVVMPANAHGR